MEVGTNSLLPSTVEESLSSCPKFRIVLIGNSGVGKSSLVQSIFKIDLNAIDIAHERAGRANIEHEYTSRENTRFILHDSQGFEAGSEGNWTIVERFLRERSRLKLSDRVHALWLCITSPREGSRLEQTGDERLLILAEELKIPVIAVFTKYDLLVTAQYANAYKQKVQLTKSGAEENAQAYFEDRVGSFRRRRHVEIVKVSTSSKYSGRLETLRELTKVTRRCLGDNDEAGEIPFILAQRVDTSQKVELSVREGFKKYWRNLGSSAFFHGHKVDRCLRRIHDDILKIWNFNDPRGVLSDQTFRAHMMLLVNPILEGLEVSEDDLFEKCMNVAAVAATAASPLAVALVAVGVGIVALKFLYGTYKKSVPSAWYLGAYITALTCVLHLLFQEVVASERTDILTEELVLRMAQRYKDEQSSRHRDLIRDMALVHGFEKKIMQLILKETNTPETESLLALADSVGGGPSSRNDGRRGSETRGSNILPDTRGDSSPSPNPERRRSRWTKWFK